MTTLWITKYALTSGIYEREQIEIDGDMAIVLEPKSIGGKNYYHGKDWHVTRDAALARAEDMRLAKIASLEKQLVKLEKLNFK